MSPLILVCSQDAELYLLLAYILHREGFEARLAVSEDDVADACASQEFLLFSWIVRAGRMMLRPYVLF